MRKLKALKTGISDCSFDEITKAVSDAIKNRTILHVVTVNAAMLTSAWKDRALKQCLDAADVVTADGMSVVWAVRFLGHKTIHRITGIDAAEKLFNIAQVGRYRLFFLGAEKRVLEKAVETIRTRYPRLILAGSHHGYFNEDESVLGIIKKAKPDILLVGMGFSTQEKWIYKNKEQLGVPVIMGVGGSFDVMSGDIPRAPVWMQKTGLEWLFRLVQEPQRLWKRYLFSNTMFIYNVIRLKLSGKYNETENR